jgi:alanine dehydrogenase
MSFRPRFDVGWRRTRAATLDTVLTVVEDADVLLLTNRDVQEVLDMSTAIDALRAGYDDLVRGDAAYVPRIDLYAPTGRDEDYHQWGSMTGTCRSAGVTAVRLKSDITSWPAGRTQEKYCVEPGTFCGLILMYSTDDGRPVALMQDGSIQHIRVGAAAGIGADLLAREDSRRLGMLGSGGMAWTYLEALTVVRPLTSVRVYSPTPGHREAFARRAQAELGIEAVAVDDAEQAVRGADIVATATDSMRPTFDSSWLAAGTHVTIVTRRELSEQLLRRADVVVQLGEHTIPHGTPVPGMEWSTGGVAAYLSGTAEERARIPRSQPREHGVYPSLFDVRTGHAAGRTSPEEVSLFVTTGTQGLQFAAVGGAALRLARDRGIGTALPLEWFLQDIRD